MSEANDPLAVGDDSSAYHSRLHREGGRDPIRQRLLSASGTDTTPDDPVQGDLIVAQVISPSTVAKWARKARGTIGMFFKQGALEPLWAFLQSTDIQDFAEAVEDVVGATMTDTPTVDFTYNDGANQITADVKKALDTSYLTDFQKAALAGGQQLTSNSTAMQSIAGIALTGVANGIYRFWMSLTYLSTAAADFQFQFTIPAGGQLHFSSMQFQDAAGVVTFVQDAPAATPVNAQGNGSNRTIEISGLWSLGATGGLLQLQAAQNTATVETTDFVVAGTNIIGVKVV